MQKYHYVRAPRSPRYGFIYRKPIHGVLDVIVFDRWNGSQLTWSICLN